MPTLLTRKEVASLFRVSPRTIKRWTADGKLTAILTPGGSPRYRSEDVDRLLEQERTA
jgi:excisionase family DNA binding protein